METKVNPFWRKQIIVLCSFILFLLVIIFALFLPLSNSVMENKRDLAERRNDLDEEQEKILQLQKNSHDENINDLILRVSSLLPNDPEVSKFIIQLENLSAKDQILIKNLSIDETRNASKNSKVPPSTKFSFDTDSTYSAIMTMIKDLENFDRFNALDTVTMLLHDQSIAIKIQGRIYYGK